VVADHAEFAKWCAALCAWREARGEGYDGMRCVIWVISNRAKAKNQTWPTVIFAKWQFSSMTADGDPQVSLVPKPYDNEFDGAFTIADRIYGGGDTDLTNGATHYFSDSIPMPRWALAMTETAKIGKHTFYREAA
jgi:N-acetylmuramoyl-L-alanine amidase